MSIARLKDYRGPALFSYGFRPFFFFGSVYAGAVILVWLPAFYGTLQLGTAFAPRDWHEIKRFSPEEIKNLLFPPLIELQQKNKVSRAEAKTANPSVCMTFAR